MNRWVTSLVLLATSLGVTPSAAASERSEAAADGARWLTSQQRASGAFFARDQRVDLTAETLAAMTAGDADRGAVQKAVDYIASKGKRGAKRGAFTGRIIAGIVAAGGDPTDFGGVDYVAILGSQYDGGTGAYDADQFFPDLLAANGALAAGGSLPSKAIDYLRANTCDGGGASYENRCARGPDVDTTAWLINVAVAAGLKNDPMTVEARTWLLGQQRSDGGFAFTKDLKTSSDSTGLALSAIAALGEDAQSAPWRQVDGDDPVGALLALQRDSGGFGFVAGSKANGTSTTQAVPGIAGLPYPLPASATGVRPTVKPATTPRTTPAGSEPDDSEDTDGEGTGTSSRRGDGEEADSGDEATPSPSGSPGDRRSDDATTTAAESFDRPRTTEDDDGPSVFGNPLLWLGAALAGGGAGFFGLRFLRR